MIGTILTIIFVILGILISISLHELGHFIPAKLFKTYVSQYFVGFGPKLWSKKIGETEYGIKAIPLGGHTTIEGMLPDKRPEHTDKYFKNIISGARDESLENMKKFNIPEDRAFYNLSTPKKLVVMMGGTFTNLIVGAICLIIALSVIGSPDLTTTVEVLPDSPAAQAGIPENAEIIRVNDEYIYTQWDWADLVDKIANSQQNPIKIGYISENTRQPICEPKYIPGADDFPIECKGETYRTEIAEVYPTGEVGSYKIGIKSEQKIHQIDVLQSINRTGVATLETIKAIGGIPIGLVNSVKLLITGGERDQNSLVSIIGLGQVAVATDKMIDDPLIKVANLLALLGSLNIALFVFNLIPLLPLDGGHSANAIYEGIVRVIAKIRKKPRPRPSDLARTMPIAYVVFGLLIIMFVIIALVDILHPIM